ncbi:MAG: NAD(+) synthase [Lachnospiraceae bacterium]|nr:NAD(+) synthase [Lachnospiraceae bacterium]
MDILKYRELVHEHTKEFDAKKAIDAINEWLDDYLNSSNTKKVVLGISGGKDSTVVAKLLADKMGSENVFGLLMPNGIQKDINDSVRVTELLGIKYKVINIKNIYDTFLDTLGHEDGLVSYEAKVNLAPRIRMTTLYTFGQTHGCRVAGTGNLSELTLGYFTKHGDGAHDFNLIAGFTSLEVMRIGEELGLPLELVYKTPDDGLSGMSDEEKLGITYIDMHTYLRKNGAGISNEVIEKIRKMEGYSRHKRAAEPTVDYAYCQVKLPDLGKPVEILTAWGQTIKAFLTRTSFYLEGVTFESIEDCSDIRISDIIEWREIKE